MIRNLRKMTCVLIYIIIGVVIFSSCKEKHDAVSTKAQKTVNTDSDLEQQATTSLDKYITNRPEWSGLWVNTQDKERHLNAYISSSLIAGEAGRLKWADIERTQGEFDWSGIYNALTRARNNGYYYYFVFWTGQHSPEWIYSNGVPKVYIKSSDFWGNEFHPYYLDDNYKKYIKTFLNKMAEYIASLPADLRERLAFIQPGFGSTGDRQLYKGEPIDAQYEINSDVYFAFMQEMTTAITTAFNKYPETRNIMFLWNIDDFDGNEPSALTGANDSKRGEMLYAKWIYQNYSAQLRKQQFTIATGYMAVDEKSQDDEQRANFYGYSDPPRWNGNPEYVRGEFTEARWANTPMANVGKEWHYYWTAISSIDRGLDSWEIDWQTILAGQYREGFELSHRYAFYKKAGASPYAFIALRDVLDYSDKERFPESIYGRADKKNKDRINAILAEYSKYGACNDDTDAVLKYAQSNYLQNSKGLNDCVWNVIPRNYSRFITQYNPNETSIGLWRVGSKDEPYGRFARSFENSTGKNAMYFKIDDDFFGGSPLNGAYSVKVKVIYYDEGFGSWELRYDAIDNPDKIAYRVTKTGSNTWKEKLVTLTDAYFGKRCPNNTDFYLYNSDGEDDIFHMIEIEKNQ